MEKRFFDIFINFFILSFLRNIVKAPRHGTMVVMLPAEKERLLAEAQHNLKSITLRAIAEMPDAEQALTDSQRAFLMERNPDERMVKRYMHDIAAKRLEGLKNVPDSPYFCRCDATFENGEPQTLYFGKFSIPEFGIYSWIAPAAQMRFATPGKFSYVSEAKNEVHGTLARNDQYLIAKGAIAFMATTNADHPRTLIHQEHFSNHKSAFMLPEIVERMEQAQDAVIRAGHIGSFLISGPAGSGKTTLALHRIAYLLQAPETAQKFTAENTLVLVQDDATKEYFDELLPSLGIKDVAITTFAAWAREQLGLQDFSFSSRYGANERERDAYEFAKNASLKNLPDGKIMKGKPFSWLEKLYDGNLTPELKKVFAAQRKEKTLDRFDLTALLLAEMRAKGALTKLEKVYDQFVFGKAKFTWETVPVRYPLILLDEVQNYLPEQIRILKSCIAPDTQAMTYVGDLAQQTRLFTLRDWNAVGENLEGGRTVKLEKVYRSTRQILEYIRSIGYSADIPGGVRDGKPVKNVTRAEMLKIIKTNPDVLIGVIGIAPEDIEPYASLANGRVRVVPVSVAQGVEFDIVFFAPHDPDLKDYPPDMLAEKQRVIRDQTYVALTRAMNELYIIE